MAPRSKSHRTLSANNRTHSTASLHKPHHGAHLAGLTTLAKDPKAPSTRDTLVKTKKHSSSSSALSAKRNTSRTNVARAAPTRTTSSDKHPNAATKEDLPTKPNTEDEGWVSSESGAATPADQGVDNEEDDDDDELDEEEILQLQTQRAKRNAREAERLRAAMLAAEAELRAQRDDASRTPPTRESPQKHTNMGPALPPSGELNPQLTAPKPHSQTNQPPPTSPLAPVTQQPYVEDHTKHTFPTQHTPSPPAPVKTSTRDGPRSSEPIPYDYVKSNGDLNGVTLHPAEVSRPGARRSNTHAPRPVSAIMSPLRVPQAPTRSATTRPHPLIRAPSILTKATPAVPPLTAPPYLSAHSAQAQISSSPPPKTPSSASTKSSPAHTRQPSISSSIHTLPTLQVSPTAPLSASVSSLPHSPQQRASSLYHHPTTSLSPTVATNPIRETSRERERTISAVSSTAALHALAHHHPLKHPNQTRSIVQASTFPPEPADTYVGGMYGGGAGAGVYVGTGTSGGYSHAVVGGSGGMYGGKPGPVHALLPAPYMATHMSVGRWYAPAREAVARIVRGKGSP